VIVLLIALSNWSTKSVLQNKEVSKEIAEFYHKQTDLDPQQTRKCLAAIQQALDVWKLSVEQVKIENHHSGDWNKYRNRTELEKMSICIGGSYKKKRRLWLVPKVMPVLKESEVCKKCTEWKAEYHCTRWLHRYHCSYPEWCPYAFEKRVEYGHAEERDL